nr:ATP-binding protein [Yimella sp. cx-51]
MDRSEEAIEVATEELQITQLLADQVIEDVGDPVLAALLLGKSAEAAERGASLEIVGEVSEQRCTISGRDLITVVGNLSDSALDAVGDATPGRVRIEVDWTAERLVLAADDNGPGIGPEDAENVLGRGWSTKAGPPGSRGIGLALVQQVAQRCDGSVSIGRSDLGGARVEVTLRGRS